MDLASQGTLFTFLHSQAGKSADLRRLAAIFAQVVAAVAFLHARGLAHRDLKPENVLLDRNLNAKICDFGWAVRLNPEAPRQTFCGTYEYIAPEIFEGQPYGLEVDCWALGVLLFEMLHGHSPFAAQNLAQVRLRVLRAPIEPRPDLPPSARQLIISLLQRNPPDRPSAAQILSHPFLSDVPKKSETPQADKVRKPALSSLNNITLKSITSRKPIVAPRQTLARQISIHQATGPRKTSAVTKKFLTPAEFREKLARFSKIQRPPPPTSRATPRPPVARRVATSLRSLASSSVVSASSSEMRLCPALWRGGLLNIYSQSQLDSSINSRSPATIFSSLLAKTKQQSKVLSARSTRQVGEKPSGFRPGLESFLQSNSSFTSLFSTRVKDSHPNTNESFDFKKKRLPSQLDVEVDGSLLLDEHDRPTPLARQRNFKSLLLARPNDLSPDNH